VKRCKFGTFAKCAGLEGGLRTSFRKGRIVKHRSIYELDWASEGHANKVLAGGERLRNNERNRLRERHRSEASAH
jgi:hypothetical protein